MFKDWTPPQLEHLHDQITEVLHDCRLLQAKRRERGAWVKPGLAGSAGELERLLLASYQRLEREVIASLSGRSDDVASGRLAQAKKPKAVTDAEEDAALDYYELAESERDRAVDRTRLAAILTLLLLFLRRHRAIAAVKAKEMFAAGRKKALAEVGKTTLAEGPISAKLKGAVLGEFDGDIERLETGLRDGTARSPGLESIIKDAATVGEAAALLRRLFDGEEFRIGMLAEALVWWTFLAGYRAAAIENTRATLQANGVHLVDDLASEDLDEEQLTGVPRYIWVGPQDARACEPCLAEFGKGEIVALSPEDVPDPSTICSFGISCRHAFELVEP